MSSSLRPVSAVILAVAFVLVLAPAALAKTGPGGDPPGNAADARPGHGSMPHGGHSTSSVKCWVCHSVHRNPSSSRQLLQGSTVADTCAYCHMNSSTSYTQVYAGDTKNYAGVDLDNAHNSYEVAGVEQGVKCTDCHQVHAAKQQMTANDYLTQKLLIGSKTYSKGAYDPLARAPLSTDDSRTALAKWCAGCHYTRGPGYSYWGGGDGGGSHVMKSAATADGKKGTAGSDPVAWNDSTYCSSCHSSQFDSGGGEWPHYTTGVRFLESGADVSSSVPATNTKQDGICLRCHRDGSGNGIGLSF